MGDPEHGVGGELRQADPQPQVVARQAPLLDEGLDVGAHHHELVGLGPGQGNVVLAERPQGQVAHHGSRLHAEHHRPDHGEDAAEELRGGVVGGVGVDVDVARGAGGQRRRQLLQHRPVGVEGPTGPVAASHGNEGHHRSGGRCRQAGGVGHPQLGDP